MDDKLIEEAHRLALEEIEGAAPSPAAPAASSSSKASGAKLDGFPNDAELEAATGLPRPAVKPGKVFSVAQQPALVYSDGTESSAPKRPKNSNAGMHEMLAHLHHAMEGAYDAFEQEEEQQLQAKESGGRGTGRKKTLAKKERAKAPAKIGDKPVKALVKRPLKMVGQKPDLGFLKQYINEELAQQLYSWFNGQAAMADMTLRQIVEQLQTMVDGIRTNRLYLIMSRISNFSMLNFVDMLSDFIEGYEGALPQIKQLLDYPGSGGVIGKAMSGGKFVFFLALRVIFSIAMLLYVLSTLFGLPGVYEEVQEIAPAAVAVTQWPMVGVNALMSVPGAMVEFAGSAEFAEERGVAREFAGNLAMLFTGYALMRMSWSSLRAVVGRGGPAARKTDAMMYDKKNKVMGRMSLPPVGLNEDALENVARRVRREFLSKEVLETMGEANYRAFERRFTEEMRAALAGRQGGPRELEWSKDEDSELD